MAVQLFGSILKKHEKDDKENKKDALVRILLMSDLHCGSVYAVKHPNYGDMTNEQKYIFNEWQEMVKREGHVDYLYVGGDIVDGLGKAEDGRYEWTTDITKQIDCAVDLVNMIDYDKLLVVYGTPYHIDSGLNADEEFAKRIGADAKGWELNFKPQGIGDIFHMSHKIGVSSGFYRTTPLAKELVYALLNEKELHKYTGIIRSHAHYFVSVSFTSHFGIITPAWQSRTPYLVSKGLGLIPKLGYVMLEKYDKNGTWMIKPQTFNIMKPDLAEV
jgi:hypothetical protein